MFPMNIKIIKFQSSTSGAAHEKIVAIQDSMFYRSNLTRKTFTSPLIVYKPNHQGIICSIFFDHTYFTTSFAPQSKTFPAKIPSIISICLSCQANLSNASSRCEKFSKAASFSFCFT